MQNEHVPSHQELIKQYQSERAYYETKFTQSAFITIFLVIVFLCVKMLSGASQELEQWCYPILFVIDELSGAIFQHKSCIVIIKFTSVIFLIV